MKVCSLPAVFLILVCISCNKPENILPSKENVRLSWWCSDRGEPFNVSMDELPVFRELQDRTDTDIRFIHPKSGLYEMMFRLMASSGRKPDIISHDFVNNYPGGIRGAVEDGIIRPIDRSLLEHAPNFSAFMEENPLYARLLGTEDGGFFCIPALNLDAQTRTYIGPFIRADLLEKHGLKPPSTIKEWENVLAVFYEDPQISRPLTFYGGNIRDTQFLIGAFGICWDFYIGDGRVRFGPAEEEFEAFIRLMRKWYSNGWLDPGVVMNSRSAYDRSAAASAAGIYVDYVSRIGFYEKLFSDKNQNVKLVPVPNPRIDGGDPLPPGHLADPFIPFASAYITASCENPEAAIRMLDYAYSPEGRLLFNYGIEGESYIKVNDIPVLSDSLSDVYGKSTLLKYYLVSGPYPKEGASFIQSLMHPAQKAAPGLWYSPASEASRLPQIILPRADADIINRFRSSADSFMEDYIIDFITGRRELSELPEFRRRLHILGIDKALDSYNRLYSEWLENRP